MADTLRTVNVDSTSVDVSQLEASKDHGDTYQEPTGGSGLEQRKRDIEQKKADNKAQAEAVLAKEAYDKQLKELEETSVKLDNGEWISKEEFNKLSPEEQTKLKEMGVEAFNTYYNKKVIAEAGYTQLRNGEYIKTDDYSKLSADEQAKLEELGIDKFNTWYSDKKTSEAGYTKLAGGEWISTVEFNKLSAEDQAQLNELGIAKYNEAKDTKFKAEQQAKIDAATPKAIPLTEGTGVAKGFTGSQYIRTQQGDIPAWMLIADMNGAFTPNGAEAMGTSYGPSIMGVKYAVSSPQEYRIARWGYASVGSYPIYELKWKDKDGNIVWGSGGTSGVRYGPGGGYNTWTPDKTLTPVNWTEDSYLAYVGVPKDKVKESALMFSYKQSDLFYNQWFGTPESKYPYIDPETGEKKNTGGLVNPYGYIDPETGKVTGSFGAHPVYGSGVWTQGARTALQGVNINQPGRTGDIYPYIQDPRSQQSASAEIAKEAKTFQTTGQLPEVPLMQVARVKIAQQFGVAPVTKELPQLTLVAANQRINENDYVQFDKDTYVLRSDFAKLSNEDKQLVEQNASQYQVSSEPSILTIPEAPKYAGEWETSVETKLVPKESAFTSKLAEGMGVTPQPMKVNTEPSILNVSGAEEKIIEPPNSVKLADGKYMDKDAYGKLEPRFQTILQSQGYDAYTKAMDMENSRIPYPQSKNGWTWVDNGEINKLPIAQQQVLKEEGFDGLSKFVAENERKLAGFSYINPDGTQSIDVLTAMRSNEKPVIENLYTQDQIDKITQGKVVEPKNIFELLQVAGESLQSPAVVQGMSKGYIQVFNSAEETLNSLLSGMKDNPAEEAISKNQAIKDINVIINKEVGEGLKGWTKFTDTWALPLASQVSSGIHQWMNEAPDWQKPERAVVGAVGEMLGVIPLSIAGALSSSAAHAGLSEVLKRDNPTQAGIEQIQAVSGVTGLGAGMAGWFLARPSAVIDNPLVEGPYTVAMLAGPEKLAQMARSAGVKVLPIPQKGTSIEAMGINPTDVARVNTPEGVSPGEARLILETMEHNLTGAYGKDIASEIFGQTRDQVNITTDDGFGKGRTIVSGLQRAVPMLLHHASGDLLPKLVEEVNTKGYFETEPVGRGVQFFSPQLSGSFLLQGEKGPIAPVIENVLYSAKDLKKIPDRFAQALKEGDMAATRDKIYELAKQGQLEEGIYPVMKWYGAKNTLEYELIATPGFKSYAIKAPWYAKQKGINTAVTYTTSPISGNVNGVRITEGQKIPMVWLATENAIAEGRGMPSLKDLYRAEVYSTITDLRKALPQNIKFRDVTLSEETPAASTMISSKLKAIDIKGPEWAKDVNQVKTRVDSGQLEPYWRQRASAIVLDQNGKLLTIQERNGKWSLPGGKIDSGDTAINTIIRELKEETGIGTIRYEKVGKYKDTQPMLTDQGGMLWRDGKPVYNEHSVYLIKVSRKAQPKAKGEIKKVDKVGYKDLRDKSIFGKDTDSFVSPILKMVSDQKIKDFIAEKGKMAIPKTIGKVAKSKGKGIEEDISTELPYRIKIKPEPKISMSGELRTQEIEPGIFADYGDSIQASDSRTFEEKYMGEFAIGEAHPTELAPQDKSVQEQITKEVAPQERLGQEQKPIEIKPGELKPTEKIPTERPPTEKIPTKYPPITPKYPPPPPPPPPPPVYPPPPNYPPPVTPPPPIFPPKKPLEKYKSLTTHQLEGAVAWKQGFVYILWHPPFGQEDVIYSRQPLPDVKYFKGVGSAAASIVARQGEIPPHIKRDMGIVDIDIFKGKSMPNSYMGDYNTKPVIRFTADPKRKTKYSGIVTTKEQL